ncbi:MAG: diguanylate cyclase [bacterium]|nr:diguanylate cyclase [bacterium]
MAESTGVDKPKKELRPGVGAYWGEEFKPYGMSTVKLISVALIVLMICTAAVLILYYVARETLIDEVRRQLVSVASTAALQIDAEKHKLLQTRADETTETYRSMKEVLRRIRVANPDIRFIYTMTSTDRPNIWQFVLDAEEDPAKVSHIGDEYDVSQYPQMKEAFSGAIADKQLSTDEWGTFLSGYAPIYDKDWQPIAILGVDMTQDNVQRRLHVLEGYSTLVWLIFLTLIILSTILYYQRTRLLTIQRDIAYQLSLTDQLTQLANRRRFDLMLDFEFQVASRYQRPLSLIMGDIDNFKQYNDTYGHLAGDELLRKLAHLIQASVRKVDLVARFGGEEFVILLPNTDAAGAVQLAEKIRKIIELEDFSPISGKTITPVTISFGVATYPTHAKTKEELLDHADDALYMAKQAGRNRTKIYINSEEVKKS